MMMALIAMAIVSTLRMVGIVLAISLLTIPQMTANIFTYNFKKMALLVCLGIGWIDCLLGLGISYWLNVPSGASIIFISIIIGVIAKLKWKHNVIYILTALISITSIYGCLTQQNTAKSRWWHAFNAR